MIFHNMDAKIRLVQNKDLEAVNRLLGQVLLVHHQARPDLFRESGKKYSDKELLAIFADERTPVFVYEEGGDVLAYAFCALLESHGGALNPFTTLYVDDLCVDEKARGRHIGRALFDYVKSFARERGCYNLTLRVWEGNEGAMAFYRAEGMNVQCTTMEVLLK